MQLVIHAPFGGRINKAWGLALRKRFCRSFNFELQAAATDNGLNIALAEQHSFPLADVFHFLNAETVQPILEQAALASPIFGTRWRWDANRALALLRFQSGKKVPPQIQRMRSDDLLASVFPDVAACQENIEGDIQIPDHPLVNEVMKDVLTEAMDLDGLKNLLRGMADGRIRCVAVDTPVPSQFSHEILNANPYAYLDDAPLEERRARAVEMRRILPESVLEEVGKLDPAAIAQVREEAWPDVRDADELHDVLHTLIAVPVDQPGTDHAGNRGKNRWEEYFQQLIGQGRATNAFSNCKHYWVAAERAKLFSLLFPDASFDRTIVEIKSAVPSQDDAVLALVTGWMTHLGPIKAEQLGSMLGIPPSEIEKGIAANGSQRRSASWKLHWKPFAGGGVRATRTGVVRAAVVGANPPPYRRHASQADRTYIGSAVHALVAALAACCSGNAGPGRTGDAGSFASAPGIRNPGQCMGAADPGKAHSELRSAMAGPTLPDWRGGLGTPLSASRNA